MLEYEPSTHKTADVHSDFPVVELDSECTAVVPDIYKDVVDNNAAGAQDSANSGIGHTYNPDNVVPGIDPKTPRGVVSLSGSALHGPLLNEWYEINIKQLYMLMLDPANIIDVKAEK